MALNLALEDWKQDSDKHLCMIAVFLDFKRAYETINWDIVIKKTKGNSLGMVHRLLIYKIPNHKSE